MADDSDYTVPCFCGGELHVVYDVQQPHEHRDIDLSAEKRRPSLTRARDAYDQAIADRGSDGVTDTTVLDTFLAAIADALCVPAADAGTRLCEWCGKSAVSCADPLHAGVPGRLGRSPAESGARPAQ